MKFKEWLATQHDEVVFDLISSVEDHAMYTIVDNPLVYSDDFKEHFAKLLDAEVNVFDNEYDVTVVEIDAPARPVLLFQQVAAGYASLKNSVVPWLELVQKDFR